MALTYREKLHRIRHPFGLLVVFQAFDVLSTRLALLHGAQEGNPVMALGLEHGGFLAMVAAKLGAMALVFVALALDPLETPYLVAALVTMDIVYGAAIAGNFLAYMQLSGDWALPVAYWGLALAIATAAVHARWFAQRSPSAPGA
ncbi:MAG TPA: DUF5658 family protein [Candidatus Thermoplasmatota archaeon]|nr:DUF5658 family protein [Candidatus Thermoplasmatota archaeon]